MTLQPPRGLEEAVLEGYQAAIVIHVALAFDVLGSSEKISTKRGTAK